MSVIQRTVAASEGGGGVSFEEIEAHEFALLQNVQTVAAPTGVAKTDAENIQKAYEALGKPGIVQLRPGNYNVEAGKVKFRKWAVWLRGMGRATINVESRITEAGTLIQSATKNGAVIEASIGPCRFTDFAMQNTAVLEGGTLSAELNSGGAAITELKVNALTEEAPKGTKLTLNSGKGPFIVGTLSAASTEGTIVELKVNALAGNIPLLSQPGVVESESVTTLTLNDGAGHTEEFKMTKEAKATETKITIKSQKPKFNFPIGTKVEATGPFIETWEATAAAKATETKITVASQKPAFSQPTSTPVEYGPYEGCYGIQITKTNAAGEENKNPGNHRGYYEIDIEGFYINVKQFAGFAQRHMNCYYTGAVKYNLLLGDPTVPDAGEHVLQGCWFCAVKHRQCAAGVRWESGGGIVVSGCTTIFNPENSSVLNAGGIPEYGLDFSFEALGKSTSAFTVNGNQIEGFTKGGVRFTCNVAAGTQYQQVGITGNMIRAFSGLVTAKSIAVECAAATRIKTLTIASNTLNAEVGTDILINNVTPFNVGVNMGAATTYFKTEGSSAVGAAGYPSKTVPPATVEFGKVEKPAGTTPFWLLLIIDLEPNEEAHFETLANGVTVGVTQQRAPFGPLYSQLRVALVEGVEVEKLETKPLAFSIPTATKIYTYNVAGAGEGPRFQEWTTSAEAAKGAEEIKVNKVAASFSFPANTTLVEGEGAPWSFTAGPYFLIPSSSFQVVQKVSASNTPLASNSVHQVKTVAP